MLRMSIFSSIALLFMEDTRINYSTAAVVFSIFCLSLEAPLEARSSAHFHHPAPSSFFHAPPPSFPYSHAVSQGGIRVTPSTQPMICLVIDAKFAVTALMNLKIEFRCRPPVSTRLASLVSRFWFVDKTFNRGGCACACASMTKNTTWSESLQLYSLFIVVWGHIGSCGQLRQNNRLVEGLAAVSLRKCQRWISSCDIIYISK